MQLILKTLEKYNRSMYVYYPEGEPRSELKRCSITVLREDADEASVRWLLNESGFAELAEKNQIILAFPNPVEFGWNYALDERRPSDLDLLPEMQESLSVCRELEPAVRTAGLASVEAMLNSWHPMNDTKYLIGIGSGASMALTMAACRPQFIAAVASLGGTLCEQALKQAVQAPIPLYMANDTIDQASLTYFSRVNDVRICDGNESFCSYNQFQKVITVEDQNSLTRELLNDVWDRLFRITRRTNTGEYGDVEPRTDLAVSNIKVFRNDSRLKDQNSMAHTWFTHVPPKVKMHQQNRVPLMMFFHGASDNPSEAAEMSKFHELGQREGFITVYPWSSNKATWNVAMDEAGCDDVAFAIALIKYLTANYPVDPQRIYLSGFSNGAAMAQVVALTHPELIAAICPIDANWPGERIGPSVVDYGAIKPLALAMKKKQSYDFRVPVWYTYGNAEPSYPVYNGCSQQHQYDFWKRYNNITVKPTPGRENPHPCGCGVPGDISELRKPSKRHPHHEYDVQRFFTNDEEPKNYYNYVVMRDKGHDIAEMDPCLGWEYVRQFRRNPDSSVGTF